MRANVRRIDLTRDPAEFELWPSLDWLADVAPPAAAPHGRHGLWDAMAHAVQRVREVSLAGPERTTVTEAGADDGADVLRFTAGAPHLAYLARVACSSPVEDELDDMPGAKVIAMVDTRSSGAR